MGNARGIVPWPGGKGWLVRRLLPLIPPQQQGRPPAPANHRADHPPARAFNVH